MTSDLVGINSNYGDTASVSGSCGVSKKVCQEYKGVKKGEGKSEKVDGTGKCGGAQGGLSKLPAC
jgi:pectate lyase